ncbi:hypothetical protein LTR95_015267 [Oleoguttula sp. CCFEE 5521]
MAYATAQSDEVLRHTIPQHVPSMASRSVSFDTRVRSEDSWVEIGSQPSSSSLSSINDEVVATGPQVQHGSTQRRRRLLRPTAPSGLHILARSPSTGTASSQEEYEESESESDRVMTSSGEVQQVQSGAARGSLAQQATGVSATAAADSSDDENRTAVNYPIANNDACFTPQPNAFSHPPSSGQMRTASQPVPGSYFPSSRPGTSRSTTRQSMPNTHTHSSHHMPQNILSPSYNAALQHDEALRASLSTLLSCAAAARSLKSDTATKRPTPATTQPARPTRIEPISFRLVPQSALPNNAPISKPQDLAEPLFRPTIRRTSTSTTSTSAQHPPTDLSALRPPQNRRPRPREQSKDHASPRKKPRRSSSLDELSPTLLTWVASVGVVVVLSALSFSAGYSVGKEAGLLEASEAGVLGARGCAAEVGGGVRRGMGLRRSLARGSVQV